MKKLLRLGVVAGALLGMVGMNMAPASATTVVALVFAGQATTSPLGYPCTPPGTTGPNCPPIPTVTTTNPPFITVGPAFGFVFSSIACVGAKVDIAKPAKGTNAYGPLCSITAAGNGRGYCGLSSASGTANASFQGPTGFKAFTSSFTFIGVGGTLVVTGTGQKTPGGPPGVLVGVVEAIPNPLPDPVNGPTCSSGTETDFIIVGAAVYAEATV